MERGRKVSSSSSSPFFTCRLSAMMIEGGGRERERGVISIASTAEKGKEEMQEGHSTLYQRNGFLCALIASLFPNPTHSLLSSLRSSLLLPFRISPHFLPLSLRYRTGSASSTYERRREGGGKRRATPIVFPTFCAFLCGRTFCAIASFFPGSGRGRHSLRIEFYFSFAP